jgi:hypothetical protein
MQRSTRRRGKRPGPDLRTVVQDTVSFVLAWTLIWYLAVYGVASPIQWGLLGLAGSLLGVTGVGEIISKARTGTAGSDLSSASPELLPSSGSSLPHNDLDVPPMI